MKKIKNMKEKNSIACKDKMFCSGSCGGFWYILGFIGAFVYYISTATGFWNGVFGFLKALIWPVLIVFEILKFLGM